MRSIIFSIVLTVLSAYFLAKDGCNYADAADVQQTYLDELQQSCLKTVKSMGGTAREESFIKAIRRGDWECANMIVEDSQDLQATEYRKLVDTEKRLIVDQMDLLKKNILDSRLSPIPSINCPFKWAQSPTEIIISVKFSHKIDAPATLNVVAKNVSLTPDRLVLFASDGKKNFHLDIEFFSDVLPNESSWSMASVGRMSFNIKKADFPTKWTGLTKGNRKLPQMHSWWEMQEKFEAELDKIQMEIIALDSTKTVSENVSKNNADEAVHLKNSIEPVDPSLQVDIQNTTGDDAKSSSTGKVVDSSVSPEEIMKKVGDKKAEDDQRKRLSTLADEARSRKRDIDIQCKRDKALVDVEIASKVANLDGRNVSDEL